MGTYYNISKITENSTMPLDNYNMFLMSLDHFELKKNISNRFDKTRLNNNSFAFFDQ